MKKLLLLVIFLGFVGCATPRSTPWPETRPDDFQIEYYWETGSLPPPYFYSYRITVGPGAGGEIKFQADYSGEETPLWVEAIDITENDLDQLYKTLIAMGMFEIEWLQATDIPTGGSASFLTGLAHGTKFSIPSFVAGKQQEKDARALYEYIKTLVPQETWEKLMSLHDEYVEKNEE